MITSTLSNLHWYGIDIPNFAKAMEYALATDFKSLPVGRYEVDGDNIFALVNEYMTKPHEECDPETHRAHIDIQIMVSGIEKFGYTPLIGQQPSTPFRADNDEAFYAGSDPAFNYITLHPGQFIIFFPNDIHQPELFVDKPELVKKVVIKVKI